MTLSDALMNAAKLLAAWLVLSVATGAALCWFITRAKEDRRPTVADFETARQRAKEEAEPPYGDASTYMIGERNG